MRLGCGAPSPPSPSECVTARKPSQRITESFAEARANIARTEHRKLTAKEYLDTVDPKGKRTEKSARDYLRRIAKGERTGAKIAQRADKGGGTYHAVFVKTLPDGTKMRSSANVTFRAEGSNLNIFKKSRLAKIRRAANKVAAKRETTYKAKEGSMTLQVGNKTYKMPEGYERTIRYGKEWQFESLDRAWHPKAPSEVVDR